MGAALPSPATEGVGVRFIDGDVVREHAIPNDLLRLLYDPDKRPEDRLDALLQLRQATFSNRTFPAWRADFIGALRRAAESPSPELRVAALEALVRHGDKKTQERLLEGLRDPRKALLDPAYALRLLSDDAHSGVLEHAIRIADDPPSEVARVDALRVLASDPRQKERFRALLAGSESDTVRSLARAALHNLDPDGPSDEVKSAGLPGVAMRMPGPSGIAPPSERPATGKVKRTKRKKKAAPKKRLVSVGAGNGRPTRKKAAAKKATSKKAASKKKAKRKGSATSGTKKVVKKKRRR